MLSRGHPVRGGSGRWRLRLRFLEPRPPAMAAGITDHVGSMEEICGLLDPTRVLGKPRLPSLLGLCEQAIRFHSTDSERHEVVREAAGNLFQRQRWGSAWIGGWVGYVVGGGHCGS